jgi:catechol 2,3-dioxygenase-like lactoylglutathione lyase family enzyme
MGGPGTFARFPFAIGLTGLKTSGGIQFGNEDLVVRMSKVMARSKSSRKGQTNKARRLALHSVLESSLYVSDLKRSIAFYRDVLGLQLAQEFEENRGAAFLVGPAILLLFRADVTRQKGVLPTHGASGPGHVAFRVKPNELSAWRKQLQECGVEIEREVSFNGQPPSIYFRDPDGNSLELAVASIWPFKRRREI